VEFIQQNSRLTHNILQSIGALTSLKSLILSNSSLTGPLPPKGWCGLRKLEELDLSGNALDGSIPSCFRNLTSLDLLDISSNPLLIDQNILVSDPSFEPQTLNPEFLQLKLLSVSNCRAKGIPNFLHYQTHLRYLDLSHNNLGNSFKGPLQLPKHVNVNMFQVDMSGNKMQGQIPMNIGSMFPHLQILNLSRNVFEGNVPPCLGGLKSLSSLDLSYNNFSGGILEELVKSGSLLTLRLSSNNFEWGNTTYNLPKWIWNVPNLEALDFSNNNFYGHIPLEFCNLGLLRFLDLSQNNLSGSVPSCINLGQNNLTRKIPYWIANLSALRILVLRGNHFEGEIPSQICQLNLLSIVDLSQNKLSGHIPSCLIIDIPVAMWRNKYCLRQRKDSTHIQATFLSMSGIDVSCNMLTGPIPPELGNLSELHSLNLSHNSLIGFKPSSFSKLEQIESLDLSRNKLSGIIPIQLMELNSLAVFNVSYNCSIPYDKAQFATFDESSYLGNPFLCGPPKHESCSGTGLPNNTKCL
ncbi:hypothetical protein E1A91_D06G059500v1, partial [Gossypium mustelinum]